MPSKIKLTAEEVKKLKGRVEAWPSLTREDRTREREAFITDFLNCRDADSKDEWKWDALYTKITQWFSNNAAHSQSRLPSLLKTHWTARQVFNERMSEKISRRQAKILKKAADEGKTMRDIVALNKARMEVWKKLTAEKRQKFAEEAEQWTAEGPDQLSKLEVIEKRVPGWVDSMSNLLWDQAGVMAQISFCHVNEDGEVVETSYDISDSWHRQEKKTLQFTKVYPNWQRNFPATWVKFCRRVLCPNEQFEDAEAVIPKQRIKGEALELDVFEEGDPILPPLDDVPDMQQSRQPTLRRYFNLHYALTRGVAGVPVPWNNLVTNNHKFLTPHSITPNHVLQDPSRMGKTVVAAIWEHILELQSNDDPEKRFRFAKWYDSETDGYFDAKYDGPPAPKRASKTARKSVRGAPPAFNPWHVDRVQAHRGMNVHGESQRAPAVAAGNRHTQTVGHGGQDNTAGHMGPGAQSHPPPANRNPKPRAEKAGRTLNDKGKGRARDDSDSAVSSDDSDSDSDPPLESDGSGDVFDFNDLGGLFGDDVGSETGSVAAGPSHAPVNKPTRSSHRVAGKGADRESGDNAVEPRGSPPVAPVANRLNPWEIEDAPLIPVQPDSGLVAAAKHQPPSWVGHIADRLFAFLWALAGEVSYRGLLTGWRHMLTRRALFKDAPIGEWANWNYQHQVLPSVIHGSEDTWERFLTWITDAAPKDNASASDVQRWLLVVGMAIRDIHVRNSTQEDEDVPYHWPEYIRGSPADLQRDLFHRLEPLLVTVYRPLGGAAATDAVVAGSIPSPRKDRHALPGKGDRPPAASHPALVGVGHPGRNKRAAKGRGRGGAPPGDAVRESDQVAGKKGSDEVAEDVHDGRKAAVSGTVTTRKNRKSGKKGPPGVPAVSFSMPGSNAHHGTNAVSGSIAEVEEVVGVPSDAILPPDVASNVPRSISEGLAKAKGAPGSARLREVPIVLIQSTIADRLKRRRRVADQSTDDLETQVSPEMGGREGDGVRRSNRPAKRRKL